MTENVRDYNGQFMLGKMYVAEHNYNRGATVSRKGLSLLEVLISSIILAILLSGLANIFVATKRLLLHTRCRATAAEIAEYYLSPFPMQIRATNWGPSTTTGNCLRMFGGAMGVVPVWTDASAVVTYTPNYDAEIPPDGVADIDDIGLGSGPPLSSIICRVSLKVDWVERSQ